MNKSILIVGGSSGLGLELTKLYKGLGNTLYITGRTDPHLEGVIFIKFEATDNVSKLQKDIDSVIRQIPEVNTLIYSAGYYQEGKIDRFTDNQAFEMINIGITAPVLFIKKLKKHPGNPLKVILISSSSGYTPREMEPLYCTTKAGLEMLGTSLGLDNELGKVVVIAPSGMQTTFWRDYPNKDVSKYLEPNWVANQILEISAGEFKYKYARILKDPARVEIIETK